MKHLKWMKSAALRGAFYFASSSLLGFSLLPGFPHDALNNVTNGLSFTTIRGYHNKRERYVKMTQCSLSRLRLLTFEI